MTEEDFQRALDCELENSALRGAFADWLEEQGDWRAAGYRWMSMNRKWPYDWVRYRGLPQFITFDWYFEDGGACWEVPMHCRMPRELRGVVGNFDWAEFTTRRAAEEAVCNAVHELSHHASAAPNAFLV
jgi:uncharacterized protein (TIGR02996 family)